MMCNACAVQLRVRLHAELVSVNQAEEEDPPGVMVDERAGRLLDEPGRFGDRRCLRNLPPAMTSDFLRSMSAVNGVPDFHAAHRSACEAAFVQPMSSPPPGRSSTPVR